MATFSVPWAIAPAGPAMVDLQQFVQGVKAAAIINTCKIEFAQFNLRERFVLRRTTRSLIIFLFVGSKMDHVSIEFDESAHLRGS